ncbi:MAG: glutamate racemase [Bacteroidales bacterium]
MMNKLSQKPGPIGIFDSGYGGLTILEHIRKQLPEYDYIYLGDNARAPYGNRSFEVVYQFTLQAVEKLFEMGCHLVVLACNTASAKALRTIQQKDLEQIDPNRRVLGIIRPTVEAISQKTNTKHIGVLGTSGTIQSKTYDIEISKLEPDIKTVGQACPLWVPLIENNEHTNEGAKFFIKKYIDELTQKDPLIDAIILGCTHYPLMKNEIEKYLPNHIELIPQGEYVASSLKDYLYRHPEMENKCTKNGECKYYTTESTEKFSEAIKLFLNQEVEVKHIILQ